MLESALEEELTDHLGHAKHQGPAGGADNIRNGTRAKTVLTDAAGEVTIEVPRDRAGTFDPVIVKKRQRRLSDVDAVAVSLYAKGLTTGAISAHFAEVYGASIGKDTISRITDRVVEEMQAWTSRPLVPIYAAVFIDAIYLKVRDGQVGNRPFYAAIGVDLHGRRDVLGLWAGTGDGESAKFWMNVLTDLKNRGVRDVFFVVCDGLKGLPDAVNAVFPAATVQACVIHLIRATLRYASRRTGISSPRTCVASIPPPPSRRPGPRSRSWRRSGASRIPRSRRCGAPRGRSAHPYSPTTSRSDGCCSAPTRSSRCTLATGAQSPSADTSPPSKPHSSACTSLLEGSTRRAPVRHPG